MKAEMRRLQTDECNLKNCKVALDKKLDKKDTSCVCVCQNSWHKELRLPAKLIEELNDEYVDWEHGSQSITQTINRQKPT